MAEWGVIPALRVRDVGAALDFYVGTLGFTVERGGADAPNTSLSREGAHLMIEAAHDFFGEEYNAAIRDRRGTAGPNALYLEASDLPAFYERVRAAGAKVVDPLGDREWGQSEFTLEDPDGNWLSFWASLPS